MTHREARKRLGSRSVRRSGVRAIRQRSGKMRVSSKPRVAVAVRRILKGAA